MFGTQDLNQVLRFQEQLRRDAAQPPATRTPAGTLPQARRVFGLRLSLA
jgi:hypothetical protein